MHVNRLNLTQLTGRNDRYQSRCKRVESIVECLYQKAARCLCSCSHRRRLSLVGRERLCTRRAETRVGMAIAGDSAQDQASRCEGLKAVQQMWWHGQHLLTKDVLASLESFDCPSRMQAIRQRVVDGVDRWVHDEVEV